VFSNPGFLLLSQAFCKKLVTIKEYLTFFWQKIFFNEQFFFENYPKTPQFS